MEEITGVAHHAFGHPLWPVAAARLANLGKDMDRWREMIGRLREEYKEQYCSDSGRGERYVRSYYARAYYDASRMEAEYARHFIPAEGSQRERPPRWPR